MAPRNLVVKRSIRLPKKKHNRKVSKRMFVGIGAINYRNLSDPNNRPLYDALSSLANNSVLVLA